MRIRADKDIISGLVLVAGGAALAGHTLLTLRIGTLANAGPGMLLAALGFILVGLGAWIFVAALLQGGQTVEVDFRALVFIALAILAFALLLRPFGLIPAVVACVLAATHAENGLSWRARLVLAGALALGATALFIYGLGVRVSPLNWPW